MHSTRRKLFKLSLAGTAALGALALPLGQQAQAASPDDLRADADRALAALYKTHPGADRIGGMAKGILIFPKIIKAGLVFGGSYGEGVLLRDGKFDGFYNSVSASWGWQAGAESYGYVVFLMNSKAVNYLNKVKGWEFGVGPHVTLVNEGIAKNLTTVTLKDDAYAFVFDQQGLMASLSIEGTKVSRLKKP
jgi:lipid-binding SYLF domain-containing protein